MSGKILRIRSSDLSGASLPGATLTGSNMGNVNFTGASLNGADLSGANLTDAVLTHVLGINLQGCPSALPTDWSCVTAGSAQVLVGPSADLSGADLSGADLSGAVLTDVLGVNLQACPDDLPTDWSCVTTGSTQLLVGPGANLAGVDLSGVDLSGVVNLAGVGGDLEACPSALPPEWSCVTAYGDGKFLVGPNANLSEALLQDADLSGADLSGANLSNASLYSADLSGADLTDADLFGVRSGYITASPPPTLPAPWTLSDHGYLIGPKANLKWAQMYQADLTNADLNDANLVHANLFEANLSGADLTGANLSQAELSGADLSGADLTDADLSGADLTDADLTGADLSDVTFSHTTCPSGVKSDDAGGTCCGELNGAVPLDGCL